MITNTALKYTFLKFTDFFLNIVIKILYTYKNDVFLNSVHKPTNLNNHISCVHSIATCHRRRKPINFSPFTFHHTHAYTHYTRRKNPFRQNIKLDQPFLANARNHVLWQIANLVYFTVVKAEHS